MKKSFLSIISLISLFALSSCACQGPRDKHYNSSEAEKKAEEYTSYNSYALSTTIELKGTSTFKDEKTKGKASLIVTSKSKVDGDNALALESESKSIDKEEWSLDEIITNSGNKSIAELKELYPNYTFDEANKKVTYESNLNSASAKDKTYYIYDNEYEQYKKLVFDSKNQLLDSTYTDYDDTDDARDEFFIIHNLKDIIKEALVNGTPKNGTYILEPEGGIQIGDDIVLDKASFKHDGSSMTLNGELAGEILGADTITEASVEVKVTELNKVKIDVPNQEVVCEHEHKFSALDDFGDKGHRKMCYDCHKYLDKNVEAHSLDNTHKVCTKCEHHPKYESGYCPEELINKEGKKLLSLQYSKDTNEIIGSSYIGDSSSYKALISSTFSLNVESKSKSARVLYYDKDEVLIISYLNKETYLNDSCLKETETHIIAFKDVKLTLTPEQQAIINDETSSSSTKTSAYKEALGINVGANELDDVKQGRTILKEFNIYYMYLNHTAASGEDVVINSCLTCSPSVCTKCNEVTYVSDTYSHERTLSRIANPSWAKENSFYFQYNECNKCHLKDDSIYEIEENNLKSHYDGYSVSGKQFNKEGQQITSYVSLYVLDHSDKDGECELCHAKALTVGNVTIHVNVNGIAENTYSYSGAPYWRYDDYKYEDGWDVSTYSKDGITIILKEKSDDGIRTFILVYDGVESSPVTFNYH